jgi:non-heme chloroperoxidase
MKADRRLPGATAPTQYWRGAGGIRLAGDSWGEAGRPLVVLQHGGGQTRHAWKDTGEKLAAAGFHAIAFDARGHGDSDWAPDGAYGQDVMVEDLRGVLDELGVPRPILVGASMGGGTSLVAAGEGRVDATALVLVDVAPRVEPDGVDKIRAFMAQKPNGFDSLDEVADAIAAYQPHRKRPKDLEGLAKNLRIGDDGRYRWHWDPRYLSSQRDIDKRRRRLEACARNLSMPTLLVRGGLSDLLTDDGVREFLQLCPQAEYVSIPGAAHMVAGDRNDVFGKAILSFLARATVAEQAGREKHTGGLESFPIQDVNDIP